LCHLSKLYTFLPAFSRFPMQVIPPTNINFTYKICRIHYWLSEEDEKKEIQNILKGQPTYPDVPDLKQAKTKPLPN